MFLSAAWLSNSFAIYDIADYIQSELQPRVGKGITFWEAFRASTDTRHLALLHFLGTRGLFIGTGLLSLLTGLTVAKFDTEQTIYLIVGIVSILLTILLLSLPQLKVLKPQQLERLS